MNIHGNECFLPVALYYVWLLRSDVRGDSSVENLEGQKDFLVWWVLGGCKDYRITVTLEETHKSVLFEPLACQSSSSVKHSDSESANHFWSCRLSNRILDIRPDVSNEFNVSGDKTSLSALAWFYIHGLNEYNLFQLVDKSTLQRLDDSPVFFAGYMKNPSEEQPEMTWLMYFLWLVRTDLHAVFDIHNPTSRLQFVYWFLLVGIHESNLYPLIHPRWLKWMRKRIYATLWKSRAELNHLFHLSDPVSSIQFESWCVTNREWIPVLRWLNQAESCATGGANPALYSFRSKPLLKSRLQFGVNLIGFAYGELGIGEDVRMAAEACESSDIPYSVINLAPGNNVRQADNTLASRVLSHNVKSARYPINIFCLTGFDTVRAYLEYGDSLFKDKYNIGWWPWELSVWPRLWHSAFERVNEIWAATQFTRVMYEASTHIPVHLMPLPVSVARVEFCSRASLGIPDSKFLFLYVFDFNSYLERKNPAAVISAFRLAFPDQDESVGLVLKTMNIDPHNPLWQQFRTLCAQDSRIRLLDYTMNRSQVLGLIESCDAYVSLHRSEGFGRTLAESMLFGKPVVSTDYSGTCDFLTTDTGFPVHWTEQAVKINDYPFVTEGEAVWANPDIHHAALQMVQARKESSNSVFINKLRSYSVQQFSAKRIGLLMRDRLLNCFQSL